jgi:hypothetical protein
MQTIKIIIIIISGVIVSPPGTVATTGLLYQPQTIDDGDCGATGEWKLAGEPKYLEKTCPNATFSITNPTWPDLGSNLVHCGGKPAANHLSYGTAYQLN